MSGVRGRAFRLRARGFTLLEIVAALSILAIAILGFQQGQSRSVRMINTAEDRAQAIGLAQMQMTEIELQLKRKGFLALPEEEKGDFKDDKLKKFKWVRKFEKVDIGCLMPGGSGSSSS